MPVAARIRLGPTLERQTKNAVFDGQSGSIDASGSKANAAWKWARGAATWCARSPSTTGAKSSASTWSNMPRGTLRCRRVPSCSCAISARSAQGQAPEAPCLGQSFERRGVSRLLRWPGLVSHRLFYSKVKWDEEFYRRFEDVLGRYPRTDLERDFLNAHLRHKPAWRRAAQWLVTLEPDVARIRALQALRQARNYFQR